MTHSSHSSTSSGQEKDTAVGTWSQEALTRLPRAEGRRNTLPASCAAGALSGLSASLSSAAPVFLTPTCLCLLLHAASSQPHGSLHIIGPSRHCPLALLMLPNDLQQQSSICPFVRLSVRPSVHLSTHPSIRPFICPSIPLTSLYLGHPTQALVPHLEALDHLHLFIWTHYSHLSTQVKRCPFLLSHAHPRPPPSTSSLKAFTTTHSGH